MIPTSENESIVDYPRRELCRRVAMEHHKKQSPQTSDTRPWSVDENGFIIACEELNPGIATSQPHSGG